MEFDIYGDEAYPDILAAEKPVGRYMVIGGLWLKTEDRAAFKKEIHELRNRHRIGGEFKWKKVSPSKLAFYTDLVNWFFAKGDQLRFRCIVVDKDQVRLNVFHGGDQELGFYKFYYQLLHHWIMEFNRYHVFCDYKRNRRSERWSVLKDCLNNANPTSRIDNVQTIDSAESVIIQLVDVLIGAVASKYNNTVRCSSKQRLIEEVEKHLNSQIQLTPRTEEKFNVFQIQLNGGW